MSGFHIQVKITSGGSRYLNCYYHSKGKGDMEDDIKLVNYFLIRMIVLESLGETFIIILQ